MESKLREAAALLIRAADDIERMKNEASRPGWRLVPTAPDSGMKLMGMLAIHATLDYEDKTAAAREIYETMIRAAPYLCYEKPA